MSWLTSLDVDWLKSNIAPKRSKLPVWDHAGAYFRQLGVPGGDSGIYEVAYHAATPGKSFSITFTVEKDVESVFSWDFTCWCIVVAIVVDPDGPLRSQPI